MAGSWWVLDLTTWGQHTLALSPRDLHVSLYCEDTLIVELMISKRPSVSAALIASE